MNAITYLMSDFAKEANTHFTHLLESMDNFLSQQSIILDTAIIDLNEQKVVIVFKLEIPLIIGIEVATKLRDRVKQILLETYDTSKFFIEESQLENIEITSNAHKELTSLNENDAIINTKIKLTVTKK